MLYSNILLRVWTKLGVEIAIVYHAHTDICSTKGVILDTCTPLLMFLLPIWSKWLNLNTLKKKIQIYRPKHTHTGCLCCFIKHVINDTFCFRYHVCPHCLFSISCQYSLCTEHLFFICLLPHVSRKLVAALCTLRAFFVWSNTAKNRWQLFSVKFTLWTC